MYSLIFEKRECESVNACKLIKNVSGLADI